MLKNTYPFVSAIIVAAGNSTRMGTGTSKQFIKLGSKEVIAHTLTAFEHSELTSEIIIVAREQDREQIGEIAARYGISKLSCIVLGGDTRQQSVLSGIEATHPNCKYFAIHDGARPLVSSDVITDTIKLAFEHGAATTAVKVKDTIKKANDDMSIAQTVDRSTLWAVHTPQVFERTLYLNAAKRAKMNGMDFTDDCQLFEYCGIKVMLCEGSEKNIKITTPEDVTLAQSILKGGRQALRIGHGYDVHKLTENRKLIMGGVEIPYEKGLLGHSDADVLCHAISDALLGAAALGDIGGMFPDTDQKFKDADSVMLLREVVGALQERGYRIENIDATIIAQAPKMKPYIEEMRKNIAAACNISIDQVNIKATTEEGLGFTGNKEGISAHAVALIDKTN